MSNVHHTPGSPNPVVTPNPYREIMLVHSPQLKIATIIDVSLATDSGKPSPDDLQSANDDSSKLQHPQHDALPELFLSLRALKPTSASLPRRPNTSHCPRSRLSSVALQDSQTVSQGVSRQRPRSQPDIHGHAVHCSPSDAPGELECVKLSTPKLESRRIVGSARGTSARAPTPQKGPSRALRRNSPHEMLRWIRGLPQQVAALGHTQLAPHAPAPCQTPVSGPCQKGKHFSAKNRTGDLIEVHLPPEHAAFRLGGRDGNVVVDVHGGPRVPLVTHDACHGGVVIQKGWTLRGCNRAHANVNEIVCEWLWCRREGLECRLAFEVDEESAELFGREQIRQSRARLELDCLLGHRSLQDLDLLSKPQRDDLLRNRRFQLACIDAGAVFELEVLLGLQSGAIMAKVKNLFEAAKRGNAAALQEFVSDKKMPQEAFSQRDGAGNVALHHTRDAHCAELLLFREPKAQAARNFKAEVPLNAMARRNTQEACKVLRWLAETGLLDVRCALQLDGQGISAAMRLCKHEGVADLIQRHVAPWSALQAALERDAATDTLAALQRIPPQGCWREVLVFQCFGEEQVWAKGCHTQRSHARLSVVWQALDRVFQAVEAREHMAPRVLRELLSATKGPRCPNLDPRAPYRTLLFRAVCKTDAILAKQMTDVYEQLAGEDAEGLQEMSDFLAQDPSMQALYEDLGLHPERLPNKGLRLHLEAPEWLDSRDMGWAFQDLTRLGAVADNPTEKVAQFLRLAAPDGPDVAVNGDDWVLAKWFGAWLCEVCNAQQREISRLVQDLSGRCAVVDEAFRMPEHATGFPQIKEQLANIWNAVAQELQSAGVKGKTTAARALLRRAASYVLDVNACAVVASDFKELRMVVDKLCAPNAAAEMIRMQNGFARAREPTAAADRDVKVLLRLCTGPAAGAVVQVQLLPRGLYAAKRSMLVPSEVSRGRFDWPEVFEDVKDILVAERWKFEEAGRRRALGISANDLKAEGFEVFHLLLAGFSAEDLMVAGFRTDRSKAAGFRAKQIQPLQLHGKEADFEAEQLQDIGFHDRPTRQPKTAGYDIAQLRKEGLDAAQLKEVGCDATQLKEAGSDATQLLEAGFDATRMKKAGFDATQLLEAGFDATRMKEAGFDATQLLEAGFDATRMKKAGFDATQLLEAGFDATRMKKAGFDATQLLEAGFDATRMKEAGFDATQLKLAGICAIQLRNAGFSLKQLQEAGFSALQLKQAGFNAIQLKVASFSAAQLTAAGFNAAQLKEAAFDATQLKQAGFELTLLKQTGFDATQLTKAGFGVMQLKTAGFGAMQLEQAGFSASQLKEVGFDATQLRRAGFLAARLKLAGFDVMQLKEAGFGAMHLKKAGCDAAQLKEAGFDAIQLAKAGFSPTPLKEAGFDAMQLKKAGLSGMQLKEAGFDAKHLEHAGFSTVQLKEAGFDAMQLKKNGCNATQLKMTGFDAAQLKDAGFGIIELKVAGFGAVQLKSAGHNVNQLKEADFGAMELKTAGVDAKQLKEVGFDARQLKEGGFCAVQLKDAGFVAAELSDAGCSATQLKQAGFHAGQLKKAGFSTMELKMADFDAMQMKEAGVDDAKQLKDLGFYAMQLKQVDFDAAQLKDAGFDATQLKEAGFDATQLREAGFDAVRLRKAGFSTMQLQGVGFDAAQLKDAGFDAGQLKLGGFDVMELRTAGFGAKHLKRAGFDATQLKTAGFDATQLTELGFGCTRLREAGFDATQLNMAGFDITQLKTAGYDAMELKKAGFDIPQLKTAGYDATQLKTAGCDAAQLKSAGYDATHLKTAGFAAPLLKEAGFDASQLKEAGFDATQLKEAGFDAFMLKGAGFDAAQLREAGFTAVQLKVGAYDAAHLKKAGFDATQLKEAGFDIITLKDVGFGGAQLKEGGFEFSQMKLAGFLSHAI